MTPPVNVNQPRIVITGIGLVTGLGGGAWSTFTGLLGGGRITDRTGNLPDEIDPIDLVRMIGGVSTAQHPAHDPGIDIAETAAREALMMAGSDPQDMTCFLGASKGAMHALSGAARRHLPGPIRTPHTHHRLAGPIPEDAHLSVVLGPHAYLGYHLGRRLGCCFRSHTVAACASGLTALHEARCALVRRRESEPSRVLVIATEASLLPLFIHSYRRLGVLAPLTVDGYRSRPLDNTRTGFILAQQAAAVVLQIVDEVRPGQIELIDTAVANEAVDLIRTRPGLPGLSHISEMMLGGRSIDLLHPHATGTVEHDPNELRVHSRFLRRPTDVYACKGALGHGLGASGLVSLVVAYLCAKARRRPPMSWLTDPIESDPDTLTLSAQATGGPYRSHAVFAAGFGGHVAAAVIARNDQSQRSRSGGT